MNKPGLVLFGVLSATAVVMNSNTAESEIKVNITNVYDGDTINFDMPQLPAPLNKMKVRILGIDTPERGGKARCETEKDLANLAREKLQEIIGSETTMVLTNYKWDKYGGRIVADVKVNGKDVRTEMMKTSLARTYTGEGPKSSWCGPK